MQNAFPRQCALGRHSRRHRCDCAALASSQVHRDKGRDLASSILTHTRSSMYWYLRSAEGRVRKGPPPLGAGSQRAPSRRASQWTASRLTAQLPKKSSSAVTAKMRMAGPLCARPSTVGPVATIGSDYNGRSSDQNLQRCRGHPLTTDLSPHTCYADRFF